ncbi:hypothetical protein H0H93_008278 [Arthromyces matolae]|nr:hypothetical protein H0H93_008278 [Arthromyces matolae]
MRLWHFNRSYICRSQRFNIHDKTGRRYLIAFLLLLGFAKRHELGFDPTVTRVEVQSESGSPVIAYRYDVEDQDNANRKSYLTEGRPISESAAHHICSRATRVWKARQIMSTSEDGEISLSDTCHVLKDVWLYSDFWGEKAIQDDIFKRLAKVDKEKGTSHESEARAYFVNILNDWRVKFEGTSDETPGLPSGRRPASITPPEATFGPVASGSSRAATSSRKPSTPRTVAPEYKHRTRQHCRTVYQEVCQSIYDIDDYEIALQAFIGTLLALHYLFIAGYVHRDVSAGNCLWYPDDKVGKLSDLEYARPYEELTGHEPRTGTPAFMAAEYLTGIRLFPVWDGVDPPDYVEPKPDQSILRKHRTQKRLRPVVSQSSGAIKEVKFNFYHDVESAFWIYLWYLVHHFPNALSQGRNNFEVFPETVELFNGDNVSRHALFTSTTKRLEVHSALSVAYTAPFDVLVDVSSMATLLSHHYLILSREDQSYKYLRPHKQFRRTIYTEMMDYLENILVDIKEKKKEDVDFSSKRCNS